MKTLIFLILILVFGAAHADSNNDSDLDPDAVANLRKAFADTQEEDSRNEAASAALEQKEADIQIQLILLGDDFATGRPKKALTSQCKEVMKDITSLAEEFSPNAKAEFLKTNSYKDQVTMNKCVAILPKEDHRHDPEPADTANAPDPETTR